MSDIFELKGVDAVIRVPQLGKEFRIADPNFLAKIALQMKFGLLSARQEILDPASFAKEVHLLNQEQVRMYLPELTEEEAQKLGSTAFLNLLNAVIEISTQKFDAVVTKVGEGDAAGKS